MTESKIHSNTSRHNMQLLMESFVIILRKNYIDRKG